MNRWWWVRHGPTHEKAFVGWRDVAADLSDTDQISRLHAHLPKSALLVSSDLRRSVQTADAIGAGRNRLPHAPQIREINFGDWDGKGFADVAKTHPDLSREFWENPGDVAPPNGESWNQTAARVDAFVAQLNAQYSDQDIIAVAHIGVIMTRIQQGGGMSAARALNHEIGNFSVTVLEWDGQWALGQIGHLT